MQFPSFENVLLTAENGILTITINRPSKLNALNLKTMQEIEAAVAFLKNTPELKGAILTGAGEKAFVAGADIAEFAGLTPPKATEMAQRGHDILFSIERSAKPIIAAVNGFALGGGCELAMSCHFRVAAENAKFGQPEVNLGLIPGYGGTQRLTQLVGKGRANELMMTADMIGAEEALRIGLVNHVVPLANLQAKCQEILQKIFTKAPVAIAYVIESVNAAVDTNNGYSTEAEKFGQCFATEDVKEGTTAFLEKRKANFQGK